MKKLIINQSIDSKKNIKIITYFICLTFIFAFKSNEKYFNIGNYYILPLLTILTSFSYWILFILKGKKISFEVQHYCMIFLYLYLAINIYIIGLPYKFDTIMSYLILTLLLFIITLNDFNRSDIRLIITSYILSGLIMSFKLLIQMRTPYYGLLRYTVYFTETEFYDLNFLALYLLFPALLSLYRAVYSLRKRTRVKYYIIMSIIILSIILTGSRAGLLAFGFSSIFIVIESNKKLFSRLVFILLICAIVINFIPTELIQRFFFDSYSDGSNQKRLLDWKYGWDTFMMNPILGSGVTWTIESIRLSTGVYYTAHNTWIGFLIQLGLIGIAPIILLFLKLISKFNKKGSKFMIGSIAGLGFGLTIVEAQTSIVSFFPLITLYIIAKYQNKNPDSKLSELV